MTRARSVIFGLPQVPARRGDKWGKVGSEDIRGHLWGLQVAAGTRKQPETADHSVVALVQA